MPHSHRCHKPSHHCWTLRGCIAGCGKFVNDLRKRKQSKITRPLPLRHPLGFALYLVKDPSCLHSILLLRFLSLRMHYTQHHPPVPSRHSRDIRTSISTWTT